MTTLETELTVVASTLLDKAQNTPLANDALQYSQAVSELISAISTLQYMRTRQTMKNEGDN